ncbi:MULTISPECIES: nuclear transport factor 2 family protein [unclassified Ruegeria]|uniref:nuclear transport factor 2 family protein n=1 Tax=unclassified Ruegeria TaxID=2625375 RepID=UPI0014914D1B|nr:MULTISPECIES: nuclear transport factor 2 family protein [unclassified Ruegeria]NOC47010.1 hypothetical protein [Ruegeria sp. HKCCD7559]
MNALSNAAKLREAFSRWNESKGSNLKMWDDYTTDDICIRSLGEGKNGLDFSCARKGQGQMHQYLKELTDAFEMVHWTLKDTIAQDDRVVGVGVTAWTHKASGQKVETPVVVICKFCGDRVCEYQEFYDTAALAAVTGQ